VRYCVDEKNVVWRIINGEMIILNFATGRYYNLNKTGSFVWKLIEKKKTVEEICKEIAGRYGIPKVRASRDVNGIIKDFKVESLITS
jgi:hypothetical protein